MIDAIAVVAFAVFLCAADQAVEDRKQSDMADVSDRRGDNTLTADDPVMEDQRAADQGTDPEDARPREYRTKQPEETLGSEDPPEQPEETLADQGTAPGEARMSENPPGGRTEQSEDPSGMQDREQGEPVQIPYLSGEYAAEDHRILPGEIRYLHRLSLLPIRLECRIGSRDRKSVV